MRTQQRIRSLFPIETFVREYDISSVRGTLHDKRIEKFAKVALKKRKSVEHTSLLPMKSHAEQLLCHDAGTAVNTTVCFTSIDRE